MHNEDRSVSIVFNGEIFNYLELRADLLRRGHRFETECDTEVLLRLYEESGEECVRHLNGQWAFAIWDSRRERLFLSRDRLGVRPLFYTVAGRAFVFGSEMKSIFALPQVSREIDPDRARPDLHLLGHPAAADDVQGRPGAAARPLHDRAAGPDHVARHWSLDFDADEPTERGPTEDEYAAKLLELLVDATRVRLRSDVPVGAYLSGGLDSTLVTALIRRLDRGSARRPSPSASTIPSSTRAAIRDEASALPRDPPSGGALHAGRHRPRVPGRRLARGAAHPANGSRAALHPFPPGARARLQGGADRRRLGRDARRLRHIQGGQDPALLRGPPGVQAPAVAAEAALSLPGQSPVAVRRLPAGLLRRATGTRRRRALLSPASLAADRRGSRRSSPTPSESRDRRPTMACAELRDALPAGFSGWDSLCQAQYLEATTLLPGYILSSQGDRMAMAHSVEARFPFLDHRVVEFAARLPPRLKMKVLDEKYLLKRCAEGLVPPSVRKRPKQPYRAPEGECFFGGARLEYVDELLSPDASRATASSIRPRSRSWWRSSASGRAVGIKDNMALVGVLSTQLVVDQFVRGFREEFTHAERRAGPAAVCH